MTTSFSENPVTKIVKSLHFADVHMESEAVRTEDTILGMWSIIEKVPPDTLDIIRFEGDQFDKAMLVPASKLGHVIKFVGDLLKYCDKHNILLRVLEGTPSHDRKQSKIFVEIAELLGLEHVVKYFDELSIEFIDSLGISVLHVPDALNHDNEVTLSQAQALLRKNGLNTVSMISMHGAFLYQIDGILSRPHHLEKPWMKLVDFYIVCGHVHGHSTYGGKIIVPSSVNRHAHNEERAKGAVLTTINTKTYEKSFEFIENEHATIFKTLDVRGLSLVEVKTRMDKLDYPEGSNVRLLVLPKDEVVLNFPKFKVLYPDYRLKKKVHKENSNVDSGELVDMTSAVKGVSITYTNVIPMMEEQLKQQGLYKKELMERLDKHVKATMA